jgi:chromosome segregation ATPase
MGNEKYLNYYIETLTSTVTDCVIRNVSMQANAKVTDDVIKEQSEKIDALTKLNADLQKSVQDLKNINTSNESALVQDLKNKLVESEKTATNLRNDIDQLITKYRDYDSIKNQSTHVETFKSELIKAREETNRVRTELETKVNSLVSENAAELNKAREETNRVRSELETKINSLVSENAGKISTLTEQHNKDIVRLNEKHDKQVNELTDKIDYLQLPPAKRKKIDELNKQIEPEMVIDSGELNSPIKDGGSF